MHNARLLSPPSAAAAQSFVTLIVLAYNHARYLPQLFSSIAANIEDIRELIFIDNGSSDNSLSLVKDFLSSIAGNVLVQIYSNPPGTGVTHAVNVALRAATSEYVAVTSGDDYLLEKRFSLQVATMNADPDAQFCYSNGYVCDEKGALSEVPIHNEATIAIFMRRPAATIVHKLYYPVPTLFTQSALFKRRALLSVNGWDEDLVIDDWPLNLKLFSRFGNGFRYIDVFVCAYRRHSTNASKRRFRQYIGQKHVLEKYAQGNDLNQGLFALIATQALASLKRKQWWRAQIFFRAAFGRKPGLKFIIIWVNSEFQRRFGSNKIR